MDNGPLRPEPGPPPPISPVMRGWAWWCIGLGAFWPLYVLHERFVFRPAYPGDMFPSVINALMALNDLVAGAFLAGGIMLVAGAPVGRRVLAIGSAVGIVRQIAFLAFIVAWAFNPHQAQARFNEVKATGLPMSGPEALWITDFATMMTLIRYAVVCVIGLVFCIGVCYAMSGGHEKTDEEKSLTGKFI